MHVKTIGMALLVMIVILSALGCVENKSGVSTAGASPVEGTWIDVQVTEDTASIPVKSIDDNTNVHFKVNTNIGEISVMAYKLDDKIFVRSNVCPPCNSTGFALDKNTLVCDSCGTVFDATTGSGIGGGCVSYPKESIPYTVSDGNIILKIYDVVAAHKKTVEVG
jgi:nitrite reductase/ring-hydroxylating ferredoxin subunit